MKTSLSLIFFALIGCAAEAEYSPPPAKDALAAKAIRVETAELRTTASWLNIRLPGEIEGSKDVNLAAALGGWVESRPVNAGDIVKRGQHLASVDRTLYQAGFDRAQAQLTLATSEQRRVQMMGDLATEQQLSNADAQVAFAKAGLTQAKARLDRATLTAPFAGTVATVSADPGEVVAPGAPVIRLVKLDPIIVSLSVPDRDVVALKRGMQVNVATQALSQTFSGEISHIGAAANPKTRTFRVEVSVKNPDHLLLPGMIATVSAKKMLQDEVIQVPQDWIVTPLNDRGLFVEVDGAASWRSVTLGAIVGDQVVVSGGLQVGDHVVITGHRELVQGDPLIASNMGICCENGRVVKP